MTPHLEDILQEGLQVYNGRVTLSETAKIQIERREERIASRAHFRGVVITVLIIAIAWAFHWFVDQAQAKAVDVETILSDTLVIGKR